MHNRITQFSLILLVGLNFLIGSTQCMTVRADDLTGVVEERYSTIFSNWGKDGVKSPLNFEQIIEPNQLNHSATLVNSIDSKGYNQDVLYVKTDETYRMVSGIIRESFHNVIIARCHIERTCELRQERPLDEN